MSTYTIAVKREKRSDVPGDWANRIAHISGLTVVGDAQGRTLRVEATEDAIKQAQAKLGQFLHIEPIVYYHRR